MADSLVFVDGRFYNDRSVLCRMNYIRGYNYVKLLARLQSTYTGSDRYCTKKK